MDKTEFCHLWLKAWTLRDADQIASFYSEHVNYVDPGVIRPISSKSDFKYYLEKLFKTYSDWEWTAKEVHPTATGFACTWVARFQSSGQNVLVEGMALVILNGNLIERNEVYYNLGKLAKKN